MRRFRGPTAASAARGFAVALLSVLLAALAVTQGARARVAPTAEAETEAGEAAAGKAEFVPGEILVRFRGPAATPGGEAQALDVPLADGRVVSMEVKHFGGSELVEGLRLASVPPGATLAAVAALSRRADVLYAAPNYVRRKSATTPDDPSFVHQYALRNTGQEGGTPDADIDADEAWDTTRGSSSVVVGIIDEGIDVSHPDLRDNVWVNPNEVPGNGIDDDANGFADDVNGWDFFHDDASVFDAADGDAHGTHVAGTVGARGNNAAGVSGVNWQVSLMSLKVLGPAGGSDSDIIDAYNYARLMRQRGVNLRVVNNSYGGPGHQPAAADAIRRLGEVGILFVSTAGNEARDNFRIPHFPSDYELPNVISVAATTRADALADFSNFGHRVVHVAAPGADILSTAPGGTYSVSSGTSMAAPHVSGAAALAAAANPALDVRQLRGAVVYGGDRLPALSERTTTGRRLNARGAVSGALEGDAAPPAPPANLRVTAQSGRGVTLAWEAPGDDGAASGAAADYDFYFVNAATGARTLLPTSLLPAAAGTTQSTTVLLPLQSFSGQVELRAFDNVGNESAAAAVAVSVGDNEGSNPYDVTLAAAEPLSSGGTALGLHGDDRYRENYQLPFNFPFFGEARARVTVSTNGALYFSTPLRRDGLDENGADAGGSVADLQRQAMIAGLWDDLRTDRPGGDVFVVTPDPDTVIFRWQAVTFNTRLPDGTPRGEQPVNFEIELKSDGTVRTRYGAGQSAPTNTRLLPVVGIGAGEPQAYVVESHTSEAAAKDLTNAPAVTFTPRVKPNRFSISGHITSACCSGSVDVSGITVNLSGSQAGTTTTDADGFYRFNDLPKGGDYTVTPSHTTLTFTPAAATFNNLTRDQKADFTAQRRRFTISGRVTDAAGAALPGIEMLLSGSSRETKLTGADGSYSFSVFDGLAYSVEPISGINHTFTPHAVHFASVTKNETVNFVANALFDIRGRVADRNGVGVPGVFVGAYGHTFRSTTTDADGRYRLNSLPGGGNYTVTPDIREYVLTPEGRTFNSLSAHQTADFTAVRAHTIQGRIFDAGGRFIENVPVRISGSASATVHSIPGNGYYLFGKAAEGGTYTVAPAMPGYSSSPASRTFADISASTFTADFVLTPLTGIDSSRFFVRQHYLDFFGREPDAPGLDFWTNNIDSCGASAACRDFKRIETSAAFFLSIEFQETGFFAYRTHRAAFGNLPGKPVPLTLQQFLPDAQRVGQGVVVNQGEWRAQLEANKDAYTREFVARPAFVARYPEDMGADAYAAALYATAGFAPAAEDFDAARAAFASQPPAAARASVLRRLVELPALAQREKNRAFVLMQYFGYLRRNPDDAPELNLNFDGYNFWLQKLDNHGGDFRSAEMVKAFITSGEYRGRFGP